MWLHNYWFPNKKNSEKAMAVIKKPQTWYMYLNLDSNTISTDGIK
jgi:hypothetical protein